MVNAPSAVRKSLCPKTRRQARVASGDACSARPTIHCICAAETGSPAVDANNVGTPSVMKRGRSSAIICAIDPATASSVGESAPPISTARATRAAPWRERNRVTSPAPIE